MTSPIPTNLVLGFLGVGKTTAILDLLKNKPDGEVWAVLVNEFGEVGIDGAILETEGAFVREVPGGCMCCVAGLPMQIGLNQLIHKARPDRLLIEPTGLGHPSQIIETLTGTHYRDVLELGPVLCLVDPRRLDEPRVTENVQFQDQVAAADIVVANKTDLCQPEQIARFDDWLAGLQPAKNAVFHTRQGRMDIAWLDGRTALSAVSSPHAHHHQESAGLAPVTDIRDQPWQRASNQGQGHFSLGWRVHPDTVFSETALLALFMDDRFARFKAVVHTRDGWRTINMADGALSVSECEPRELSRIEVISEQTLDMDELDASLRTSIEQTDSSC
ncbi:GTP-binding protein [Marinobacter vulgaris]|uniref:GTP-binding protein n=1 Tax=Marinobacter vulgaris TaxID=1928331 RepID=A0A2V3ZI96_9GAMM|nr:GTP-binding protein [Marinobacter vulgaris]PXX90376.1 GTP-binding protein [Marinobacter vulgaris]TSJ69597.1 GTP-binding protein [Marinobacter vulgaris]